MRNQRAILFLGLAILLGLTAAFVAKRYLQDQQPTPVVQSEIPTVPVVIAKLDVSVGTALDERALTVARWPEDFAPKGAIAAPENIAGRVVRRALSHGEPVLEAYLLPEGSEAGLPAVIHDKLRAVSVKVDPVIGVAGFVRPGSRVDVLATLRRLDQPKNLPYSRVILQDVPVLAIDQQLEEAKNGEPELVSVVTLEVKTEAAEKLIYSAHEGRLQLALRRPGDEDVVKTQAVGVADLLGGRKKRVASAGPTSQVEVIKGSSRSVRSF
jgi:pilus assembly protein CpaB